MNRFTLKYSSKEGVKVRLFNLSQEGVEQIRRVQGDLGSHGFVVESQPRNFSQEEILLLTNSLPGPTF